MATTNQTPTPAFKEAQKSGINLADFEDIKIYKSYPVPAPVTSIEDALARLGNDNKKLLAVLTDGLNAEANRVARESEDGWFSRDEKGNEIPWTGQLADSEDVNPAILLMAKMNFGFDEISKDDPQSAEKKRAAKDAAKEQIKTIPAMIDGLRKKAAAKLAKSE